MTGRKASLHSIYRMSLIRKLLRRFGVGNPAEGLTDSEAETLRTSFKSRYHNFKLLLNANNKALQIMSEMEEMARGGRPFGMSFIRANCTAVSVNVFRIVKCMEQLAPGKYDDLSRSFREIQARITDVLSEKKETGAGPLIIPLEEIDKARADEAGNKMANLGEIKNHLGINVPNGFVITSQAFREFVGSGDIQGEIDRLMQSSEAEEMDQLFSLSADIQQLIIRAEVPSAIQEAIISAYAQIEAKDGKDVKVSLRSSALGEDSGETSFAGQYKSELNVSPEHLIYSYKTIAASKYSLQAMTYRLNKGIRDEDVDMCVGCMSMVSAVSGGVMYSKNPLNARDDTIFIHSVWGLPKSVVDGSVGADLFAVSRSNPPVIAEKRIARKAEQFVCYPDEGVCRIEIVGDRESEPSLSDEIALELAQIAIRIENHYGVAQDIEWALDEQGRILILQCRPLSQASAPQRHEVCHIEGCEIAASGGIAGSPGAAFGQVCVVRKEGDALMFPKGGVLVVKQALPRWAALLGRAAALVAEQGTSAGHLANVAREFGVPAILGMESATDLLKNDEVVTVDADSQRIYRGEVEELLRNKPPVRSLMEGSPVLALLRGVCENIIPLNLLDPEGLDFRACNCRTLHDITRFCHEKSVKEMFSFGKDHHFSERASKQLVCQVPMQWWVLNLDDGFKADVPGKFVSLDNIECIPMLALWEGIIAVPWEGPPPVDSKGFMSILLEASSNPALDPSMPSPYANRNYFMISKNFCSLSSRFGFHFSTIEALVSDRPPENYISFGFKGGAADHARRVRRARFVGEILEELDFRSEIKDDGVMARIEGYAEDVMKHKLKVLGYLLIHTRQLDMVMFNDVSYRRHKSKLLEDICSLAPVAC